MSERKIKNMNTIRMITERWGEDVNEVKVEERKEDNKDQ